MHFSHTVKTHLQLRVRIAIAFRLLTTAPAPQMLLESPSSQLAKRNNVSFGPACFMLCFEPREHLKKLPIKEPPDSF